MNRKLENKIIKGILRQTTHAKLGMKLTNKQQ